jgi:hypothetical protein
MIRTYHCLPSIIALLLPMAAVAIETNILDIAKTHPLGVTVNGVPAKYGDPDLAKAADALADVSRPWTVPKIIEICQSDSAAWLRKLQHQRDIKSDNMWDGWEKEQKRCEHLVHLLSASRDPRVAVLFGKALDSPDWPDVPAAIAMIQGLYDYFFHDPKYHRLPAKDDGPYVSTNLLPEEERRVRLWWKLNKEDLESSVKAQFK